MNNLKVLVVGSGGREHALAWKLAQDPNVAQVFVAPGNAGTAGEPKVANIPISVEDIEGLMHFAQHNAIDLTIIGPEMPLVMGIVDRFQEAKLNCFGPSQQAAQLEGSKVFCKNFLKRHHIPTAAYGVFTEIEPAKQFAANQSYPLVIKASGLAAGKGVVITYSLEHAMQTIEDMLAGNLVGTAGNEIVIEAFLEGQELSFIAMVDGDHVLPLATSQDHKTRDDGDKGPNTGGMGAYSPAPFADESLQQAIMQKVMYPTVRGMKAEGTPFVGFLYAGLMISPKGEINVLEFNCRFGDPETQPILMRLQSSLVSLCLGALKGELASCHIEWDPRPAIGVVLASGGYPGDYEKGKVITGLPVLNNSEAKVFHCGTIKNGGDIVTNGGRVLCVTALGNTLQEAQDNAYTACHHISFDGCFFRTDIGYKALQSGLI